MAKPRIFISSTYFDLRAIRSDLERYIKERNFDPVLNERGHIAYASSEKLEDYCYKEIAHCNILISIIGGRFGSSSNHDGYSISQKELKTALDQGKQIYIFIEKSVLNDYRTYEKNKNIADQISFSSVDNVKVLKFLDEVFNLPINNQYTAFDSSQDIINYLQEQWASLFHSLLQDAAKQKEVAVLEDLKATAKTLNQLVTFLTEERKSENNTVKDILFVNHPIFTELKQKLRISFRVFFYNLKELEHLLKALGYEEIDQNEWDESSKFEWIKNRKLIMISCHLFNDDGKLNLYTPEEWDEDWVQMRNLPEHNFDDELPF